MDSKLVHLAQSFGCSAWSGSQAPWHVVRMAHILGTLQVDFNCIFEAFLVAHSVSSGTYAFIIACPSSRSARSRHINEQMILFVESLTFQWVLSLRSLLGFVADVHHVPAHKMLPDACYLGHFLAPHFPSQPIVPSQDISHRRSLPISGMCAG